MSCHLPVATHCQKRMTMKKDSRSCLFGVFATQGFLCAFAMMIILWNLGGVRILMRGRFFVFGLFQERECSPDDFGGGLKAKSVESQALPESLRSLAETIGETELARVSWRTNLDLLLSTKENGQEKVSCNLHTRRECKSYRIEASDANVMSDSDVTSFQCNVSRNVESQAMALTSNALMLNHYEKLYDYQFGASSSKIEVFLQLLIKSAPNNYPKRTHIRTSWIAMAKAEYCRRHFWCDFPHWGTGENKFSWFYQFVVGLGHDNPSMEKLIQEQSNHRDLLLYPDEDAYRKLTWKVMWEISWAMKNYAFKYLLLLDDDTFLRFDLLADYLRSVPSEDLYAGLVDENHEVDRKPGSLWYVDRTQFSPRTYPPFVGGATVFLSRQSAQKILNQSKKWKHWFGTDDTFLAVLLEKAKVKTTVIPSVHSNPAIPVKLYACAEDNPRVQFSMAAISSYTGPEYFHHITNDNDQLKYCPGLFQASSNETKSDKENETVNDPFVKIDTEPCTENSSGDRCTPNDGVVLSVQHCILLYGAFIFAAAWKFLPFLISEVNDLRSDHCRME